MRTSAVDDCRKVLAYYGIDASFGEAIDVGGTPIVWLDTKPSSNPLLEINPRLIFLDKGFNVEYFHTYADQVTDFLDPQVAQAMENRFDMVFCFDTLEHVSNPFLFCAHLLRIAKPGGYIYSSTLFSWGYHPSPNDYFRFSPEGLHECFQQAGKSNPQKYAVIWCDWESDRRRVALLARKGEDGYSKECPPLLLQERVEIDRASRRMKVRRFLSKLGI